MILAYRIIKDFWQAALATWLVLLAMEIIRPGTVIRFINLEYWFYGLFIIFIFLLLIDKKRF